MANRKDYYRQYYLRHKKHLNKLSREWQKEHSKYAKKYMKVYYPEHSVEIRLQKKLYYLKNREKIIKCSVLYRQEHKKERSLHDKRRKQIDLAFKLRCYLGSRISEVLKGNPKIKTTMKLVGCSIDFLKQHLENKFKPGMSWKNYGKWHIDHIRPCASFDLRKPAEQKKCFHYSNLQPLWAKENLVKGKFYALR